MEMKVNGKRARDRLCTRWRDQVKRDVEARSTFELQLKDKDQNDNPGEGSCILHIDENVE
jgi:hypothetical protein